MSNGGASSCLFRVRKVIEGGTARIIDCSWTLCFGWFAPEHHGAICPRSLATGTACSSACADGQRRAFGRVFSMRWLVTAQEVCLEVLWRITPYGENLS